MGRQWQDILVMILFACLLPAKVELPDSKLAGVASSCTQHELESQWWALASFQNEAVVSRMKHNNSEPRNFPSTLTIRNTLQSRNVLDVVCPRMARLKCAGIFP